jgi:hypothetical protein
MARRKPRKPRRLYDERDRMLRELTAAYQKVRRKRARAGAA